jgi:type II secretory pathway component PulF
MPIYVYKAVDAQGKLVKGEMEAATEMGLTTELAKLGLLPVNISFKAKTKEQIAKAAGATRGAADPKALVIFSRQFATIIKAAVPIIEGLGVLAEQAEDPMLKKALNQIIHDVEGGSSLSGAMSKHPGVFSELYVNTVVAGESAGILDKVLLKLANMLEEDMETQANIAAALRYPVMVVIALVIAVVVLTVFVMPQFSSIYAQAEAQLPLPTMIMMFIGLVLRKYWYAVIAGSIAAAYFARWFVNTPAGRYWWDGVKFDIAVFGKVYTKMTMLRFASMLNVLYQSGLPVLKTLDIVGLTIGNAVLSKEIDRIKKDVADGKGISGGVLNSKFFPRLVGYMISVGEKSGSLPQMLDSLCDYFNLEVKTAVRNLTSMIEPLMTAVLGVVIMGMALAIFLPLWNMINIFKKGG